MIINMSRKTGTKENFSNNTNEQINNNNNNNNDFQESVSHSLDETKDNINRSIDESRNEIPRINNIVNSYQEQSLQTAREISEEYIDTQKQVINSLQSAWRPYNEVVNGFITNFFSPDAAAKAYTRFVSNIADNTVSAMRLSNNAIFSTLDAWKPALQQAKDISRYISNTGVNTARAFEQNSRQLGEDSTELAHSNTGVSSSTRDSTHH